VVDTSAAERPEVEGPAFHGALAAAGVASHRAFLVEAPLVAFLAASRAAVEGIAASVETGDTEAPSSPAVEVAAYRAVEEVGMVAACPAGVDMVAAYPVVAGIAASRVAEEIEMVAASPAAVGTAAAYPAGAEIVVAAYPVVGIVACRTCPAVDPGDPAYRKACRPVHYPYPAVAFRRLPAFEVRGHRVSLLYLPV
jgi:hypothetical protein